MTPDTSVKHRRMQEVRRNLLEELLEPTKGSPVMMPAREIAAAAKLTTPTDREIRIERIFNAPRDHVSLFHTSQERDGMMSSGMEQGLNQSYAALDALLARPS